MNLLKFIKLEMSHFLWKRSFHKYHTTMSRKIAPLYENYLEKSRSVFGKQTSGNIGMTKLANDFLENGFASFWTSESKRIADSILSQIQVEESSGGDLFTAEGQYRESNLFAKFPKLAELFEGELGAFLRASFGSHYKIYYGILYKSVRTSDQPEGSQIWHSDGGPGTCINLMFCLSEVNRQNGGMECVPWKESYQIQTLAFKEYDKYLRSSAKLPKERLELRRIKSEILKKHIEKDHINKVALPSGEAGMLFPFRNNLVHKGGFPDSGYERYVIVFHVYPAMRPFNIQKYISEGVQKKGPFPESPDFGE